MKILFVCSANYQRSKTAEDYFRNNNTDHLYKSAGTNHKECEKKGTTKLTAELMLWADVVYVMEQKHADIIHKEGNAIYDNKIHVLSIEDIYQYNSPELIKILKGKIKL